MKTVYGYIRVSTAKQGIKGVSLKEQKDAIERYAQQHQLDIVEWYEERETAAKLGRSVFRKMIVNLQAKLATGVVIHKIDRSARNLRDWADLVDLADQDVEVHFVNESIDMAVRGGRLSADIQAVVAADYVRNLREETIKGIRGRLKQGLFPFRAPVGYLDTGGGNVKEIDPVKAPIIKSLFEYYATGEYSHRDIRALAKSRGLTNVNGGPISLTGIATILHNPFYAGVIYIKSHNESYTGVHEPIITQTLFDQVQHLSTNKTIQGKGKHEYLYRRMFTCFECKRSLIGEKQKGRVYYRCHLCSGVSIREDAIESVIEKTFEYCELTKEEIEIIEAAQAKLRNDHQTKQHSIEKVLKLELGNIKQRLSSLTDKLLDETIDKDTYLTKKDELVKKIQSLKNKLAKNAKGLSEDIEDKLKYLELYKSFNASYQLGKKVRRQILKAVTSNRFVQQKNIVLELHKPFQELCDMKKVVCGAPDQDRSRTFDKKLEEWIEKNDSAKEVQSP